MLGRLRATALEHAPLSLPSLFPDVPGFPRLQELSAEERQQGTSTLTLITERNSFASWALGHHVPRALFSLVLLGLSTGLSGILKMLLPSTPCGTGLDISFSPAHLETCISVTNMLQPVSPSYPRGINKSPW